jgi:hypothetical protein
MMNDMMTNAFRGVVGMRNARDRGWFPLPERHRQLLLTILEEPQHANRKRRRGIAICKAGDRYRTS